MMDQCSQIRVQMAIYLDDELRNGERDDFELHMRECDSCRELFEQELLLLERIRASQPLYLAPPNLRSNIERVLH